MIQVELDPGLPGGKRLYLRPICGHDEAGINELLPFSDIELIDRLLITDPSTSVASGKARELAIRDRDFVLASIYQEYFGDHISGNLPCANCNEGFEISFSLGRLIQEIKSNKEKNISGPDEKGVYSLVDGTQFRLPTSEDLSELSGLDVDSAEKALLERCTVNAQASGSSDDLQSAMEKVGPNLCFNLDATCPHCSHDQKVLFDLKSYVMKALTQEKRYLNHEIHCIASVYGWSHAEILSLTREDRQTFTRLIGVDASARHKVGG